VIEEPLSTDFFIVDVHRVDEHRYGRFGFTKYIHRPYKSYAEAARERTELLVPYPADHAWRKRLCIQHPDGRITNPDTGGTS
jgi:hypothetical protein